MINPKQKELYSKWKKLVNMSAKEIKSFLDSDDGKVAGLSRSEASDEGIKSGRDSARAIIRMLETPVSDWTNNDWEWAGRQVSFISRMKGVDGSLKDEKGEPTRKLLALKVWGHNPMNEGFEMDLYEFEQANSILSEELIVEGEGSFEFQTKGGGKIKTDIAPKDRTLKNLPRYSDGKSKVTFQQWLNLKKPQEYKDVNGFSYGAWGVNVDSGKAYGWSHRAVGEFFVGKKLTADTIGNIRGKESWTIETMEQAVESAISFAKDVS